MKKKFALLFIILLLGLGFYFLKNKTSHKASDEKVIKIGAILPLTGKFAEMSMPIKYAMDIAEQEINDKGGINGKKIKIIYADCKGNPTDAVTIAKKMIDIQNIKVITTFLTSISEAVKPITEKKNVLLLAQTVSPTILKNTKNTIRYHYNFVQEGESIVNFINSNNFKKVSYLLSNDSSDNFKMENVIKKQVNQTADLNIIKFNIAQKDKKSLIIKAMQTNPQLICMDGYGIDIYGIIKELYNYKLEDITLFGNIGFIELPSNTNPEYLNKHKYIFTLPSFYIANSDELKNFKIKMQKISNNKRVGYSAYYAYDMIYFFKKVLEKDPILEHFKSNSAGNYSGITGNYSINAEGDMFGDIIYGTFDNNKILKYQLNEDSE